MNNKLITYLIIAILGIILLNFLLHMDLLSLIVGAVIGYLLHEFGGKDKD